jgi:NhaP-type Na+/H+ and K+/H+ antiporter
MAKFDLTVHEAMKAVESQIVNALEKNEKQAQVLEKCINELEQVKYASDEIEFGQLQWVIDRLHEVKTNLGA